MKMMQKWFAVVAVVALLCSAMPLSALAFAPTTTLTHIKITIDTPYAGREADFDIYPSSDPVSGVMSHFNVPAYLANSSSYHHAVAWRDMTEERYLDEGETFVLGHSYQMFAYVMVNNPMYYLFGSGMTAAVNGNTATVHKKDSTLCQVIYDFGVCKEAPADITNVTIGGGRYPVAGDHPVFEVAFDEQRLARASGGTAFKNGVAWYDADSYYVLDEDDVFVEGRRYTMMVHLNAINEYRFAVKNGESAVKATINGFEAKNISNETDNPDRELKVSYTFTCVSADRVGGGCFGVWLNIDYPVGGGIRPYSYDLVGQNAEYNSHTDVQNGFYDGVQWMDATSGTVLPYSANARFTAGKAYTVKVLINAKSILTDDTRLGYVDLGDGNYTSYVLAYVNGLPARVEAYEDANVGQRLQIVYDFPACGEEMLTICDMLLKDVKAPVVGKTPDMSGTLEYRYVDTSTVTVQSLPLTWMELSGSGERPMTSADTFQSGNQYGVVLELDAGSLADFYMDAAGQYGGDFTANGACAWQVMPPDGRTARKSVTVAVLYELMESQPAPISSIDIIGAVAPTVGGRPCLTANLTDMGAQKATITEVSWYKNGEPMSMDETFVTGYAYRAVYRLEARYPFAFATASNMSVTVNGDNTLYNQYNGTGITVMGNEEEISVLVYYGTLTAAASSGVTDYVEIDDIMRPAPGQTPDFTAQVESVYTQFGGITWCELDADGNVAKVLDYFDTFKPDTSYRLEVRALPSAGRTINVDSRGMYLNGDAVQTYYLSDEAVVGYVEYTTADCISELNIADVQYPIPGKTPDVDVVIYDNRVDEVWYTDEAAIDWYYETNPGTAGAGFAKLDGRFKADRRHQACITAETNGDYWFATDKDGRLTVDITVDRRPIDFMYATDTYLLDGACNELELARTFELAKDVDGVFVDGMWLTDGLYMSNSQWGVQTEETVDKTDGYAYYENGVLTLVDFHWTTYGDYNAVDSYKPLTIGVEGESSFESVSIGICTNNDLILSGDGELEIRSYERGIFAMSPVTVNSGAWVIYDQKYEGIWLYDSLTMNGGVLDVYGKDTGLYGDDYPLVTVNGGILTAASSNGYAIGWCDMNIKAGATVTVADNADGSGGTVWDGETDFIDYSFVQIAFDGDVLPGDVNQDGAVDMMDAFQVYAAASSGNVSDAVQTYGDMNSDGVIDMMDAFAVFKIASGS